MAKSKFGDASSVFLGLKQQPQPVAGAEEGGLTPEIEEKLARVAENSPLVTTQIKPTAVAEEATETSQLAEPPRAAAIRRAQAPKKAPEPPPEPEKVIKDSYSMPPADYDRLIEMERTCMRNLRKTPRSVLLRLGVRLLAQKSDAQLLALVDGVLAEGKGGRKG